MKRYTGNQRFAEIFLGTLEPSTCRSATRLACWCQLRSMCVIVTIKRGLPSNRRFLDFHSEQIYDAGHEILVDDATKQASGRLHLNAILKNDLSTREARLKRLA